MKQNRPMNLAQYLLFFIVFFIGLSCEKKDKYNEKKEVVITGKVIEYSAENTILHFTYSQPGVKELRELIEIDDSGNFVYRLESYIPLDASISIENTNANVNFIYHPGDSIYVEFEAKSKQTPFLKTVKFSGDGAKTNNQIVEFQISREVNNLGYGAINQKESFEKSTEDFLSEMNLIKDKQLELYEVFVKKHNPTNEAKNWAALFSLESYFLFLDEYSYRYKNLPTDYFFYNKEILPITTDKMICWKILENRISRYIQTQIFQDFSKQYPAIDLISSLTHKTSTSDSLFIKFVSSNESGGGLLNQLVLSGLYKELINNNMLDSYKRNQNAIKTEISESFIIRPLHESFEKQMIVLKSPNERTIAILKKMKNTPIEETFNKILEENKSKVIYIDNWATWCKPCLEEMPDSKVLKSKFKQTDVAFVYLCHDDNKKLWREILTKFELDASQQYLLDKKQRLSLGDIMQIDGFPFHILIDKKGHIIELGHNLSPSLKSTEEKITELVNEI